MTAAPSTPPQHRHPGSRRGVWTIVAIFVLGFAVLGGLYLSPKSHAPSAPGGITNGLPNPPIAGVLLDCRPYGASPQSITSAIRRLAESPDLLVLVDIESSLVPPVIEAFGMERSYHAELFQRSQASLASREKIGVCILSKHGLFEGTPMRIDRRSVGVETVMVVENRAMRVRCIALDDAPLPPSPAAHPKAWVGGATPVVLTAGRIGGKWIVDLNDGSTEGLTFLKRQDAPVGVAFSLGAEPAARDAAPTATRATAAPVIPNPGSAPVSAEPTSRPGPAPHRAE
ncbi:hypothetical protein [Humisphaera borealis]|uniref:Uncharacterized protein n=1 Tax=Humisphaera borealis TaxID=2807512 RepID=A0A7M2X129_9BACT|nr:hypothetical protein [Humisphaera borealis]QOV91142.1 hypothetical protein IPV69_07230 [Humisphaera borealis]